MRARQIVLDTETTGLDPAQGHRLIEIGCVELVNRRLTERRFHTYLQPDRRIDAEAIRIHGITNERLAREPRFADIADQLLDFVRDAELIIHNAPFDLGFLNHELRLCGRAEIVIEQLCAVEDTLVLARQRHPGQRNTLDALCKRYNIDNAQRTLHGALLDAEILADVYLAMTRQQSSMFERESNSVFNPGQAGEIREARLARNRPALRVLRANPDEAEAHMRYLDFLDKSSGGQCVWKRLEPS